jgi:hypothetical protein
VPQPTPLRSNKSKNNKTSEGFLKKMKHGHDITPRGNRPFSFIAPLYTSIPNLGDSGLISYRKFVDRYNLSSISLSRKWIKIPRNIMMEDIHKYFGAMHNKNG